MRVISRAPASRSRAPASTSAGARGRPLFDGDVVHVPEFAEHRPTVLVQGAVVGRALAGRGAALAGARLARPDAPPRELSLALPYVVGEGVRELVLQAGGLAPWADCRRAYLTRRAADGTRQRFQLDLVSITTGQHTTCRSSRATP